MTPTTKAGRALPCIEWTGLRDQDGYGRVNGHNPELAHRAVWRLMRGPIPKGVEIDHLCRNRACTRLEHLELVTHRENTLRGQTITARNAAKTHCIRGHPFDEANTRYERNRWGHVKRACRTCRALNDLRHHPRKNAILAEPTDDDA